MYQPDTLLPFVKDIRIYTPADGSHLESVRAKMPYIRSGKSNDVLVHAWLDKLPEFLERFEDVEALHLVGFEWRLIYAETKSFLVSHFASVTRLVFKRIRLWSSNDLVKALDAFPCLRDLEVEALQLDLCADYHWPSKVSDSALLLDRLVIGTNSDCVNKAFIWWLCGKRRSVGVRNATIVWSESDMGSLVFMIRKIGPCLQELMFERIPDTSSANCTAWPDKRFDMPWPPVRLDEPIVLGCTSVGKIQATIDWDEYAMFTLKMLCQLLDYHNSHFRLHLKIRTVDILHSIDWTTLDDVVCSVSDLKANRLEIELSVPSPAGRELVARMLPKLSTRDVLVSVSQAQQI
ncbi:hypothetical protein OBBRIDRAFT_838245 [Obba rivulosa]|uniref:Uncharacterized protein n=1 Tax=Obba rivulosa TaxID=1052685 RepID=A0A8E2AQX4_9APHY|nr:hypothetical protein OBBRIDRAFT_838245 [Obba rivulosa]